jgi:hypothetical protein
MHRQESHRAIRQLNEPQIRIKGRYDPSRGHPISQLKRLAYQYSGHVLEAEGVYQPCLEKGPCY